MVSWRLILLASTVAALAIKTPAVVSFDIFKSTPEHNNDTLKKRGMLAERLRQEHDLFYFIDFHLGTPPQRLSAILDTGSEGFTILSSSLQNASSFNTRTFNESNSSTSKITAREFSIRYVDGVFMRGRWAKDMFTAGDIHLPSLEFGLIEKSNRGFLICGIGLPIKYPKSVSFPWQMKNNGLINHVAYSIWLNSRTETAGMIIFGGMDRSLIATDLYLFPIVDSMSRSKNMLAIKLDEIHIFNPGKQMSLLAETSMPLVLDTGSPISRLPHLILRNLYSAMGAVEYDGYWYVPCSQLDNEGGFILVLSGARFEFTFAEVAVALDEGSQYCVPGFLPDDMPLLGANFLRVLYLVYDLENLEIGVARANIGRRACHNPSDVVEISESILGTRAPGYKNSEINYAMTAYSISYWYRIGENSEALSPKKKATKNCFEKRDQKITTMYQTHTPTSTIIEYMWDQQEDIPSVIPLEGEGYTTKKPKTRGNDAQTKTIVNSYTTSRLSMKTASTGVNHHSSVVSLEEHADNKAPNLSRPLGMVSFEDSVPSIVSLQDNAGQGRALEYTIDSVSGELKITKVLPLEDENICNSNFTENSSEPAESRTGLLSGGPVYSYYKKKKRAPILIPNTTEASNKASLIDKKVIEEAAPSVIPLDETFVPVNGKENSNRLGSIISFKDELKILKENEEYLKDYYP